MRATVEHAGASDGALHSRLAEVLHRLRDRERTATGPDRRVTFRLTRAVLGAARASGVPARDLAECLDVTVGSIRARAVQADMMLSEALVEDLIGQPVAELRRASAAPLVPASGGNVYDVTAVVRAVLASPTGG